MMKKWQPAPPEAAETFEALTADLSGIELRKMFGYSCAFCQGNMFTGLHEAGLILRLTEADREEFATRTGGHVFEPFPGRSMREYMVVPEPLLKNLSELRLWVEKSLAYVRSLPLKEKKQTKATATKASKRAAGKGAK